MYKISAKSIQTCPGVLKLLERALDEWRVTSDLNVREEKNTKLSAITAMSWLVEAREMIIQDETKEQTLLEHKMWDVLQSLIFSPSKTLFRRFFHRTPKTKFPGRSTLK